MDFHGDGYAGIRQNRGKFRARGFIECDVGHQSFAKKSGHAAFGASKN